MRVRDEKWIGKQYLAFDHNSGVSFLKKSVILLYLIGFKAAPAVSNNCLANRA